MKFLKELNHYLKNNMETDKKKLEKQIAVLALLLGFIAFSLSIIRCYISDNETKVVLRILIIISCAGVTILWGVIKKWLPALIWGLNFVLWLFIYLK